MDTFLTGLYMLGMMGFALILLIQWCMHFNEVKKYFKYGLALALILMVSDLSIPVISGNLSRIIFIGLTDSLIATRTFGFVALGMLYCKQLGRPSFPLLLKRFKIEPVNPPATSIRNGDQTEPSADFTLEPFPSPHGDVEVPSTESEDPRVAAPALQNPPVTENPEIDRPANGPSFDFNPRRYWGSTAVVIALSVVYTVVLFHFTSPSISELLKSQLRITGSTIPPASFIEILSVIVIGFGEEIIFRLGIQSFIANKLKLQGNHYWIAILITALLWTCGHAGTLDPTWIKLAQIFPIGLMLGWLAGKYGIESSMTAHIGFNVIAGLLSPLLITP